MTVRVHDSESGSFPSHGILPQGAESGADGYTDDVFLFFFLFKDSCLGNCATRIQGEFSLLTQTSLETPLEIYPEVYLLGVLSPIVLKTKVSYHKEHSSTVAKVFHLQKINSRR